MLGMLKFADILKFVIHTFDDRSFPEHYPVSLCDVNVFHVFAWSGDHLDAIIPE